MSATPTPDVRVQTTTFAFYMAGWKKPVFKRYFPDRNFVFPSMFVDAVEFKNIWAKRILGASGAEIFVWSKRAPPGLIELAKAHDIPLYFVEDGFLRSVKANASRTPPLSLALDRQAPYFDSSGPSDLETLLKTYDFDADSDLLERARAGIRMMLKRDVSKYNIRVKTDIEALYGPKKRKRVLVIGQVEDDASIRYGCAANVKNNDLVVAAASENPGAEIFYKPHPDVLNCVRLARSNPQDVRHLCTILNEPLSMGQALDTIDHVYTITSLSGFEAVMRGVRVTAFGCPFYSGWGLTEDRQPNSRRGRNLSVEALFAGVYLLYPRYFNPDTGGPETFETTVDCISNHLEESVVDNSIADQNSRFWRGPSWRPYGPYGILGWRHLLSPLVALIIGKVGNAYDVQAYRDDPISFFRDLQSPDFRRIGRVLYPFDK